MIAKCLVCKKDFIARPFVIKKGQDRFCSRECFGVSHTTREKRKCLQCAGDFETHQVQLKKGRGKFCSAGCWYKYSIKEIDKECPICKKIFKIHPHQIKRGWKKFCSRECASVDKRTYKTCNHCGKKYIITKSAFKKGLFKCCSTRCAGLYKRKRIDKLCLLCAKPFWCRPCNIKLGGGKFCSMSCSTIYHLTHSKRKETAIEKAIENELKNSQINYVKQQHIPGAHTIVDFILPDTNIIIYCDGDYWHNFPNNKARDIRQNKILKLMGYKVYRFREQEIKKSPKECIQRVIGGVI